MIGFLVEVLPNKACDRGGNESSVGLTLGSKLSKNVEWEFGTTVGTDEGKKLGSKDGTSEAKSDGIEVGSNVGLVEC